MLTGQGLRLRHCTPFYVDVDGDGYGAGQAMGFCGTTPPVGYSAQSGDCCDSAPNLAIAKLIHPGADFQTTSAGGTCNITWDYDCSGAVESNPRTVCMQRTSPACTARSRRSRRYAPVVTDRDGE